VVRFNYPARGARGPVDLVWYDGGIHPPTPPELAEDDEELPREGMLFVGDKGKILSGFQLEDPHLIPLKRMRGVQTPPRQPRVHASASETPALSPALTQWVAACRGDKQQSAGSFLNAGPLSELVNLYAVALRTGRRLLYDAHTGTVTNVPEANKLLSREYRRGWDPLTI
jgi:hypothetical protein